MVINQYVERIWRILVTLNFLYNVSDHLLKAANLSLRTKVVSLFEDATKLLDKVKMELSVQEENYVSQSLAT